MLQILLSNFMTARDQNSTWWQWQVNDYLQLPLFWVFVFFFKKKQGAEANFICVLELEVNLENANRDLEHTRGRVEKLEKEKDELQQELEVLKARVGESPGPPPPPPPPPPVFTTVHTQQNLKKKVGALKSKLQGDSEADKLSKLAPLSLSWFGWCDERGLEGWMEKLIEGWMFSC